MRTPLLCLLVPLLLTSTLGLAGCDDGGGAPATAASGDGHAEVGAEVGADDKIDIGVGTEQAKEPAIAPESPLIEAEAEGIEGNVITRSLPRFHDAFESDGAFLDWMETFYIHKQFERTPEAMGYYCSSALFEDNAGRIPMADYFGQILKQSDETVERCYDELMLEGRVSELTLLGIAAWTADTPVSRQLIYRARGEWKDESLVRMFHMIHQAMIVDTMDRSIEEDPRVILMLWYEFFATGDELRMRKAVQHSYMFNAPEGSWQRAAGELSHAQLVRVLPFDPIVRGVVEEEAAGNPMTAIRTHLTMLLDEAGPLRERPGIAATP